MTEATELVSGLRRAIIRGELKTVQQLVKEGLSPAQNIGDSDDESFYPLQYAIKQKKTPIAVWLIANGADVNAKGTHSYDYPILMAARAGKADILQALIAAGADIHLTNSNGWTALDMAAECDDPCSAAMIKALVGAGAEIERVSKTWGTPLIKACWAPNYAAVSALIECGADVNAITPKSTPLLQSLDPTPRGLDKKSEAKVLQVVAALLAGGADPNLRYEWPNVDPLNQPFIGKTPLEYARELKRKKVIELLEGKSPAPAKSSAPKELVAADITGIWKKLEKALKGKAPGVGKLLAKAAKDKQLAELESTIGTSLPQDFRASCMIHDGMTDGSQSLTPAEWLNEPYYLMPIDEIAKEWRLMKQLVDGGEFNGNESSPDDGIGAYWWHTSWIPVLSNGGGDLLCIDLAPTANGAAGQVIQYSHETSQRRLIARSFVAFLNELAERWSAAD